MKILFITPYLPSETSGHAGAQLIFRNIKMLASQHTIILSTFVNSVDMAEIHDLEKLGVTVIPVLYERNRRGLGGIIKGIIQNFFPLIKSILGLDIFFIAKYNRRKMKQAVIKSCANFKPDLIQIEYNVMHHFAGFLPNIPKVLSQHDISTKVYFRGSLNAGTGRSRRRNARLFKIAKRLEFGWMKKFDKIITVTEEDKQFCISNWQNLPAIEVIPPQVHVNDFKVEKNRNEICFIGSFNREPNLQALEILLDEIIPRVKNNNPEILLKIAGKYLPEKLINKVDTTDGANYFGFVQDIDTFVASSTLFVAPIFIGAGLKMKLTHSLACGTPVLTTPIGAEGINIGPENGLWIEKTPDALSEKCFELVKNEVELEQTGIRGKKEVNRFFSPQSVNEKLNTLYGTLI
ncbi:MAG: glycosyltransferase family 4 protein [Candidatus Marinimicrobia bacterium]|nr:glycosyltransferase family 4 protein [Candidatus Neomarinimicrobiota bacterium]MBL7030378.1 glycosyltransferase family 4 protein [Candidatus Neomarinimicrobiota bacterium]